MATAHRRWVRVSHWTIVASFFILVVTGILILMVHPRLYWGEVGNDLVPAFLEIPISNNHQPENHDILGSTWVTDQRRQNVLHL